MTFESIFNICLRILDGFKTLALTCFDWFFTETTISAGLLGNITIVPFELLTTYFFVFILARIVFPD